MSRVRGELAARTPSSCNHDPYWTVGAILWTVAGNWFLLRSLGLNSARKEQANISWRHKITLVFVVRITGFLIQRTSTPDLLNEEKH